MNFDEADDRAIVRCEAEAVSHDFEPDAGEKLFCFLMEVDPEWGEHERFIWICRVNISLGRDDWLPLACAILEIIQEYAGYTNIPSFGNSDLQ